MKNMQKIIKQAQKMQKEMARSQEALAEETFETTVGGGMVTVVMTGDQKIQSIKIDKGAAVDDIEMVEDMIIAAVNKLHEDIQSKMEEQMGTFTGGLSIPGMF